MSALGYILIGIAAVFVALLASTVGVDLRYSDEEAAARFLLNGVTIVKLPLNAEKQPPAARGGGTPSKKADGSTDKSKAITGIFENTKEALDYAKRSLGVFYRKLIKKIVVRELKIHLSVSSGDMVATTVEAGGLSALVNTMCATLSHMVTLKRCDVNIVPCYTGNEIRANICLVSRLRVVHAPLAAVALYPIFKELKERKEKNERASNQLGQLHHNGEVS